MQLTMLTYILGAMSMRRRMVLWRRRWRLSTWRPQNAKNRITLQ